MEKVEYINHEEYKILLDSYNSGKYEPVGRFILVEGENRFVAIDNSTGDCWTEEFKNTGECVAWLFNKEYPKETETVEDLESAVRVAKEIKNVKTDWRKALEIIEYLQTVNLDHE